MHSGSGSIGSALFIQLFAGFALLKLNTIALAAAANLNLHMLTQSVNAGYAHAVQATGNLIATVAEFTTGMQHSHNYFNCRFFLFFHHVHGNTTAIIYNRNTIIRMDDYLNLSTVTGQGFVNTVVHNLVHQMVQTACRGTANIHSRPLTNSFQAFQHMNLFRIIAATNGSFFFNIKILGHIYLRSEIYKLV